MDLFIDCFKAVEDTTPAAFPEKEECVFTRPPPMLPPVTRLFVFLVLRRAPMPDFKTWFLELPV